ncbi:MAG: DUF2029 domain-containing protein [Chloroflexi bacterium]|nr:DUF2029 domain-containing protein [Chloroflexota bacterium]
MKPLADAFVQHWKESPKYRIGLVLALLYFLIRLGINFSWHMEWLVVEGWPSNTDLKVYWNTGQQFRAQEDLYFEPKEDFSVFVYTPIFAMLMGPVSWASYHVALVGQIALTLVCYAALYWRWFIIFQRYGLEQVARQMILWLPAWLVSAAIIYDLTYLNVYTLMALLATLLVEAVLREDLGWSVVLMSLILPAKPHWAFPLALPFLLRRWRFGFRLLIGGLVVFAALVGLTILIGGYDYVSGQFGDYLDTLRSIPRTFAWSTSEDGHFGFNHSIMQIVIFFGGVNSGSFAGATLIKAALWLPLLWAGWLALRRKTSALPGWPVEWVLVLYSAIFILIDVMHEVTWVLIVFAYLHVMIQDRILRRLLSVLVWLYVLADILTIAAYALWLPEMMGYVPLALLVLLAFYGVLVFRLLAELRRPGGPEIAERG